MLLVLGCASTVPKVKDVTELDPPHKAQASYEHGEIRITWEASADEALPDFEGYNIYYANESLILTAIKKLPPPVMVDKNQHACTLADLQPNARYFLHVRSRNRNDELSFPSLPELIVATGAF